MKTFIVGIIVSFAAVSLTGCASKQITVPPVSMSQYVLMANSRNTYADHTIFKYNIQRACDESLSADRRLDSLCLARELYKGDSSVAPQLSSLVANPSTPPELKSLARMFLAVMVGPRPAISSPLPATEVVSASAASPAVSRYNVR